MEYVRKNNGFRLPVHQPISIEGMEEISELLVSGEYDVVHYFRPMSAWILKLTTTTGMVDILIPEESARYIVDKCGVPEAERDWMSEKEHDMLLDWRSQTLNEADFGLEDGA